jgi:hypothetical protein
MLFGLLALTACGGDTITVDGTEVFDCFVSCETPDVGPAAWLEGRVVTSDGDPLTLAGSTVVLLRDSIDEVFFLPDSIASEAFLFIEVQNASLGTGAVDGRFARAVSVDDLCAQRLFAIVAILGDSGNPVAESEVQPMFATERPPGCPFPDAGTVPADTVLARELVIVLP